MVACKQEKKSSTPVVPQASEMSLLMGKMFDVNTQWKTKIIQGENLSDFPKEFLQIHAAKLTDPADRTPRFTLYADLYLKQQQVLFEVDSSQLKNQFNQTVTSCIACHQYTCPGPIPRIRKLLIP